MKRKLAFFVSIMILINILQGQTVKYRYRYPCASLKLYSLIYPNLNIQYNGHYTTLVDQDSNILVQGLYDTTSKTFTRYSYKLIKNGYNEELVEIRRNNSQKWSNLLKYVDSFGKDNRFIGNFSYAWDTLNQKFNYFYSTNYFYNFDNKNRLIDSITGYSNGQSIFRSDSTHFEYNSKYNKLQSLTFSAYNGIKSYLQYKNDSFVFDTINNKSYYIHKEYKNYLHRWQSNYIMTRTWNGKDYLDQKDSLDMKGNPTNYSFKEQYFSKDDSIVLSQTDGGSKYIVYGANSFKFPTYSVFYGQPRVNAYRAYDYDSITKTFHFSSGTKTDVRYNKSGKIEIITDYFNTGGRWQLYDSIIFSYDSTYVSAIPNSTIDNPYSICIYPNPALNQINLNIHSVTNSSKPLTIEMIDNMGNQVQVLLNVKTNSNNLIDIQNLSTGMYHLNFFDGSKQVGSKTLMKE